MKAKRKLKIVGNILTIISIIFIVNKLWKSGFDITILMQSKMILMFLFLIIIQVFKILIACFPWLQIVEVLSGEVIPFSVAQTVYVKSNLYKYIPGNVFQYIGRNGLAIQQGISHIDVGFATLLDIGIMFFSSLCTAIILMKNSAVQSILEYKDNIIKIMLIGVIAIFVLILIMLPKYKDKIKEYFLRYIRQINIRNIAKIFYCIIYYAIYNVVSCIMFILMIGVLTDWSFGIVLYYKLAGAYVLSFVIGFITPGASGGLGIREAAMLVLSGGLIREDIVVLASIVMRVVGVVGDITAYFMKQLVYYIRERK